MMFERPAAADSEPTSESSGPDPASLPELRKRHAARVDALADPALRDLWTTAPEWRESIAARLGFEFVPHPPARLPEELVKLLPAPLARVHQVVPLRATKQGLDLLAADPFRPDSSAELAFVLGCEVRWRIADPEKVRALIRQHYPVDEPSPRELPPADGPAELPGAGGEYVARASSAGGEHAPVIQLVNEVLARAIRERASDLHFEPFQHEYRIRQRVDGTLHEISPPPPALAVSVASRLKVLANLDIAERRRPQDGRIRTRLAGVAVDLRVSTLPTQFGESVVVRVLDQSALEVRLPGLGLPVDVLAGLRQVIHRPNGILLVTGPTGAGKTTTLYSALGEINHLGRKLLTIEDPVEYEIEGVMQVPINPAAGLTFASALRSFLRQDPDVILVGEIRDLETARIALQAAMTGHLVLSTLHTNDAASAVTRLLDMGVEPFLLTSTVEAVLAQRLVRRICPHCRQACVPAPAMRARLGPDIERMGIADFFRGSGCVRCSHTGHLGRLGIFEWLPLTEPLRELVARQAPAGQIRQEAVLRGMTSLREGALRALAAGITTVEEVLCHT